MSLGSGTLTWHCAERVVSNLIVARSTGMNGMPANMMTTIATHTRFSMRIDDSTPLLPSSAPSLRAFEPLLDHDGHERQREHAAGHEDGSRCRC